MWPALFRFIDYAPIEKVYYDYQRQTLKGFKYKSPYGEIECRRDEILGHNSVTAVSFIPAYELFQRDSSIMGVILANNQDLIFLYPDSIGYMNENGLMVRHAAEADYSIIRNKEYIPVGYERTYVDMVEISVFPGRIFYCPEIDKIYYKGAFHALKGLKVKETTSMLLYKKMITTNKNGVILLEDGNYHYLD